MGCVQKRGNFSNFARYTHSILNLLVFVKHMLKFYNAIEMISVTFGEFSLRKKTVQHLRRSRIDYFLSRVLRTSSSDENVETLFTIVMKNRPAES